MADWKFLKDELPEIGSTIDYAEYVDGDPFPSIRTAEVDEEYIKNIYKTADRRDMWKYDKRAQKAEDAKDPYGIPNVNFTIIDENDDRWEEYKKQRLERGFDSSELWNLDSTIIKFALPRLKAFREDGTLSYPDFDEARTPEGWHEVLDKMIWWMENYNDDVFPTEKSEQKEFTRKLEEGKSLFFKYFSHLWN